MRYYGIQIFTPSGDILTTDPKSGKFVPQTPAAGVFTYTSYVNGISLPGALNIEFDIPIAGHATPQGAYSLRIWGPPLAQLSTAADLTNLKIALHGGMQKGLPLANPEQRGLIAGGIIKQSFGNWIGTDMTLDLVIWVFRESSGWFWGVIAPAACRRGL